MSVPFEHSERMPGTTHVCGARGPRGWRGAGSGARGPGGGAWPGVRARGTGTALPWPAFLALAFLALGHPNWSMNPSITRWK